MNHLHVSSSQSTKSFSQKWWWFTLYIPSGRGQTQTPTEIFIDKCERQNTSLGGVKANKQLKQAGEGTYPPFGRHSHWSICLYLSLSFLQVLFVIMFVLYVLYFFCFCHLQRILLFWFLAICHFLMHHYSCAILQHSSMIAGFLQSVWSNHPPFSHCCIAYSTVSEGEQLFFWTSNYDEAQSFVLQRYVISPFILCD